MVSFHDAKRFMKPWFVTLPSVMKRHFLVPPNDTSGSILDGVYFSLGYEPIGVAGVRIVGSLCSLMTRCFDLVYKWYTNRVY